MRAFRRALPYTLLVLVAFTAVQADCSSSSAETFSCGSIELEDCSECDGKLQADQTQLEQADGLAIEEMDQALELRAKECCSFFVFRLPPDKE